MFRLLRLKPPHGWNAVAWELAIVTLGVLIALAAQQWAEDRNWQGKARASKEALREELAIHYDFAVEYRVVYPCLRAQLDALRDRVLESGSTLAPARLYEEVGGQYVIRMPAKFYPDDVWHEALADGTIQHFEPAFRRRLAENYAALEAIHRIDAANSESEKALIVLARPIPLDPSTRYSLMRDIELLGGQLSYLDLLNGQILDSVEHLNMVPPANEARQTTERYGTFGFCQRHRLPLRSFNEAMQSIPN